MVEFVGVFTRVVRSLPAPGLTRFSPRTALADIDVRGNPMLTVSRSLADSKVHVMADLSARKKRLEKGEIRAEIYIRRHRRKNGLVSPLEAFMQERRAQLPDVVTDINAAAADLAARVEARKAELAAEEAERKAEFSARRRDRQAAQRERIRLEEAERQEVRLSFGSFDRTFLGTCDLLLLWW